ncbi:latrophilin receptor A [Paramuricea clavata]|uniref:Latrophilin receptor A n=1 Tax=Paramuricea clavata TaxID=317549 RepID=A0A6S7HCC1_PARCT|nr:latrophilin receptor A [Paramuricea clavata]
MGRCFSFRLLYRVVLFSFCLIFACFYHGGGSEYDRREDKTEPNKLKERFNGKPLNADVSLDRDIGVPILTENAKQIDGEDTKKETDLSKMARKGTLMKTLRSERIRKSTKIPPSENDLSGTAKRETLTSLTTPHLRSRREIDAICESPSECANFILTIKYEDNYRVWNNFSIMYQGRIYYFYMYRVTDDGLRVCTSSDTVIQQRWWNFIVSEKIMMASRYCNASVDGFHVKNYTVDKNFTVFFKPTGQSFTRRDYGMIFGHFAICSAKLSLSCNDDLVKVKYDEQYNVLENFSLFYNNKMYDYREYRIASEGLEMCASDDSRIQALWITRNSWKNFKERRYICRGYVRRLISKARLYTVTNQFTVYWAPTSQYFTRNDYAVINGEPNICDEKFRPESTEYTHENLLMCNDSIMNIKYDDEYKVWTDFSILYKNKVYDYTEYRVLNDSIKICNSTDNVVRNIWKVRNKWVKVRMHQKSCNKPIYFYKIPQELYTIRKDFSVLVLPTDQVIAKYDYGVFERKLEICEEKVIKFYYITSIRLSGVAPLCALALSIISVLLLLIVYCMLPELRTLPGLNLMSLSFAFLLWLTYIAVFLLLYFRVGKVFMFPCDKLTVTSKFLIHNLLMNAVVNVYHLRKTFCGNTLVKSDENKWKTFLKYSLFSWGVPLIITIVYIVLVKKDVLRYYQKDILCFSGHGFPLWLTIVEKYGLQGCLLLYIIVMFPFTAYRIRQKLKTSSSIAQRANVVKKRSSFVLLLKLSTTTAISFFPVLFAPLISLLNDNIQTTLFTVVFLSGVYIGIAFVFTRKNYRLLKKKYFPAKNKPVNV